MMFDKCIDWKFLDLWKVPLNAFSTTLGFHKELGETKLKEIKQKALDAITMTGETQCGKAKSFDRKEVNDKVNEMIKSCLKND